MNHSGVNSEQFMIVLQVLADSPVEGLDFANNHISDLGNAQNVLVNDGESTFTF